MLIADKAAMGNVPPALSYKLHSSLFHSCCQTFMTLYVVTIFKLNAYLLCTYLHSVWVKLLPSSHAQWQDSQRRSLTHWPLGWNYVLVKKTSIDINRIRPSLLRAESGLGWVSWESKQQRCRPSASLSLQLQWVESQQYLGSKTTWSHSPSSTL